MSTLERPDAWDQALSVAGFVRTPSGLGTRLLFVRAAGHRDMVTMIDWHRGGPAFQVQTGIAMRDPYASEPLSACSSGFAEVAESFLHVVCGGRPFTICGPRCCSKRPGT